MKPVKSRRYVNNNLRQLNPTPNNPTTPGPPLPPKIHKGQEQRVLCLDYYSFTI